MLSALRTTQGIYYEACTTPMQKEYERTAMPRGEFEAYLSKCVAQGIDYGIKMPYGELNAMIEGNKRKKSVLRNLTRQIPLLRNIIRDVYVIPSVNPEFEAKATEWLLAQINSRTGKGDFECLEQVVMNVGRDNVEWQCNPRYDAAVTGGMEFSWSEYYGSGLRAD